MTAIALPPGWTLPEGYAFSSIGECRSCHAPIAWTTTPNGKAAPLDPDGHSHFATCPQAADWTARQKARQQARA